MPAAVTLEKNSFKVTVNDVDINADASEDNNSIVSFDDTNHKFTVTIPWAATTDAEKDDFFYHDAPAKIVVTYNGVLTSTANLGSVMDQKTTIRLNLSIMTRFQLEKRKRKFTVVRLPSTR